MKKNKKIAIKVGYVFGIFFDDEIQQSPIHLQETGDIVCIDETSYILYSCATYKESTFIDILLDSRVNYNIKDYVKK